MLRKWGQEERINGKGDYQKIVGKEKSRERNLEGLIWTTAASAVVEGPWTCYFDV
jgi:hypothetical protein